MGGMDIQKQGGQSATDAISKAIIKIVDERELEKKIMVTKMEARKNAYSSTLSKEELNAVLNNIETVAEKEVQFRNSLVPLIKSPGHIKSPVHIYEVKFNPSQISFQAYGGRKVTKTDLAKASVDNTGPLKMEYQEMAPRIQMNVQLIFDDYERTQAFMMEKITDPAALVRTGVVAGVSAYKNKTYSVRPQVEGFIGALRNNFTRKILFCWGNMVYTGVLTHVGAEYTMFSTDGNPIRANVNLGMLCTDETLSEGYMGQWQESYQTVFESDKTTNLGSVTQHVGNLFNVNL